MLQTLLISTPFFALVLLGFVACKRKLLHDSAVSGLNAYVLYFALPSMLWRLGENTSIKAIFDPLLFAIYGTSALSVVFFTFGLSRRWGLGRGDAAMGALVAAFPNSGFLGLPLLISLMGSVVSSGVMLTLWVDMVLTSSLCIALSPRVGYKAEESSHSVARGRAQALWSIVKTVLTNPLPWAIGLGAWSSVEGLVLPKALESTVDLLAHSASPVALFALGGVLARVPAREGVESPTMAPTQLSENRPISSQEQTASIGRGVEVIAVIKLVVHPLLVWTFAQCALQLSSTLHWGLSVQAVSLEVLVLVAALPSASNVVLLAYRQGASQARIARIVMLTTVVSFVSFSVIKTFYEYILRA